MTTENEKLIKGIVVDLRRLVRTMYMDTTKESKRFGITGSQSGVLKILHEFGPLPSADLSRKLHVTPSNMTGLIDRLEKKNLVRRVRIEGDRRVAIIELTDQGKSLSLQLPESMEEKLESKLSDLDRQHVLLLSRAMKELLSVVET